MNEIVRKIPNEIIAAATDDEIDPLAEYVIAETGSLLEGRRLSFTKGDWTLGKDKELVPPKTRYIALFDELAKGWVRWENGKATQQLIGLVMDRYRPPAREELGDTDQSLWEVGPQGPKDPWAEIRLLALQVIDSGEPIVFSTSTRGGRDALSDLVKAYRRQRRRHPGKLPIVEINSGDYQHKKFGKTKIPVFTIRDWIDDPSAPTAPEEAQPTRDPDDEIPF